MKRTFLYFSLLTALGCQGENIIMQKQFSMDKITNMMPTTQWGRVCTSIEPDGRDGNCIRLNTIKMPANVPKITACGRKKEQMLMTMNTTHAKLELFNDIVELTIYVKGKGCFRFGLYHFDQNRKNIGLQTSQDFKVDSPEKWEKYSVRMTVPIESNYYMNSCDFLPGLIVFKESDLRIDDMTFTIYSGSELWDAGKKQKTSAPVKAKPKTAAPVKGKTQPQAVTVSTLALGKAKIYSSEELRNAKRGKLSGKNQVRQTPQGIEVDFDLNTPGEDACFVTIDLPETASFNQIKTSLNAEYSGQIRPFLVLEDAGGEQHYFPMCPNRILNLQKLNGKGDLTLTTPIRVKNVHASDRISQRWGGDRNQRIDFPVKRITLGIDDLLDGTPASGKICFKTLEFIEKK